ncbi:hypothetical protein OAM69_01300 [bacterium]|nr:hypothetical protein [bacterium]
MHNHDAAFVGPIQVFKESRHGITLKKAMIAEVDDAINSPDTPDTPDTSEKPRLASIFYSIRQGAWIASLLRFGGAALMVASLSVFLLQGVEVASDLQRYLLLLGQTLLLTAAGFAVGYLLKEPRGARMFFSLGLISIPANFAVLGAMIYSIAPLDDVIADYPTYASWHSSGFDELLIAASAGLLVLLPMSLFCFAIMARQSKWWLSAGYLLSCATLLIPVRDNLNVTLISSICAVSCVVLLSKCKVTMKRQSTTEERFAKAILFIPPVLMLVRSAMLYSIDIYFMLVLVTAVYYLLRRLVSQRTDNKRLSTFIQYSAWTTAMMLAFTLASLVSDTAFSGDNSLFAYKAAFVSLALSSLALNFDLSRIIKQQKTNNIMHTCWATLYFLTLILDTLVVKDMGFSIELVLSGILIGGGIALQHRMSLISGVIALTLVLFVNGSHLFSAVLDTGWIGLAIAGASTIVAGSLLERFWPVVKPTIISHFARSKASDELNPATRPEIEHCSTIATGHRTQKAA